MIDKLVEELKDAIESITSDERYHYSPAQVHINAPLALIQVAMKSRVDALNLVLDRIEKLREAEE